MIPTKTDFVWQDARPAHGTRAANRKTVAAPTCRSTGRRPQGSHCAATLSFFRRGRRRASRSRVAQMSMELHCASPSGTSGQRARNFCGPPPNKTEKKKVSSCLGPRSGRGNGGALGLVRSVWCAICCKSVRAYRAPPAVRRRWSSRARTVPQARYYQLAKTSRQATAMMAASANHATQAEAERTNGVTVLDRRELGVGVEPWLLWWLGDGWQLSVCPGLGLCIFSETNGAGSIGSAPNATNIRAQLDIFGFVFLCGLRCPLFCRAPQQRRAHVPPYTMLV